MPVGKLKHIDQSGFPLQLGLAHAITASTKSHGWQVLHEEHGWTHAVTGASGFIDLVLENQHQTFVLNVECKRVRDVAWQFLLPHPSAINTEKCKFWASYLIDKETKYFDWLDFGIDPVSFQSSFCVMAGQDPKVRPMLERIASSVVESTEALASEDYGLLLQMGGEKLRVYVNVIATTAKLEVCKFDPKDVDIATGEIAKATFEEVPYIRFRKQLSPSPKPTPSIASIQGYDALAIAKENTVLVVQASRLIDLLGELELDKNIEHALERSTY